MKNDKKKSIAGKMVKSKAPYDSFSDMMAYEDGSATEPQVKKLFQHLVDTGQAWHLQGSYGRAANHMLESGFIKKPKHGGKGQKDAYGNNMESYYGQK